MAILSVAGITVATGLRNLKQAKHCQYAFSSDVIHIASNPKEFHPKFSMQFSRSQTTLLKH